jgi:hypothetical protein
MQEGAPNVASRTAQLLARDCISRLFKPTAGSLHPFRVRITMGSLTQGGAALALG